MPGLNFTFMPGANRRAHASPISIISSTMVILMGLLLIRLASSPFPSQNLLLLIGLVLIACGVASFL